MYIFISTRWFLSLSQSLSFRIKCACMDFFFYRYLYDDDTILNENSMWINILCWLFFKDNFVKINVLLLLHKLWLYMWMGMLNTLYIPIRKKENNIILYIQKSIEFNCKAKKRDTKWEESYRMETNKFLNDSG